MAMSVGESAVRGLTTVAREVASDAGHAIAAVVSDTRAPAALTVGAELPDAYRAAMTTFNQYVIAAVRHFDSLQSGTAPLATKGIAQHSVHEAVQLVTQMSAMFGSSAPARTAFANGIELGQRSLASLAGATLVGTGKLVADVAPVREEVLVAIKTGSAGLNERGVGEALATVTGSLGSLERGEAVATTHLEALQSLSTARDGLHVGMFDGRGRDAAEHLEKAQRLLHEVQPQPLYQADALEARSLLIDMQRAMGEASTRVIISDFQGMGKVAPRDAAFEEMFRGMASGQSLESGLKGLMNDMLVNIGREEGMDSKMLYDLAASAGISHERVDEAARVAAESVTNTAM